MNLFSYFAKNVLFYHPTNIFLYISSHVGIEIIFNQINNEMHAQIYVFQSQKLKKIMFEHAYL